MSSALLILTGSRVWTMKDGTPHPTGFWAREFMEAYTVFTAATDVRSDRTTRPGSRVEPAREAPGRRQ